MHYLCKKNYIILARYLKYNKAYNNEPARCVLIYKLKGGNQQGIETIVSKCYQRIKTSYKRDVPLSISKANLNKTHKVRISFLCNA